ncbi:MAG TPA: FAD-dependent oxidoreductase [Anaerolineaceae bacterium]|nr:FAD-dependent oxidoreductase [Anaerolineaceae bacterium]
MTDHTSVDKFDVIVVGAGVAGSTAAYLLARQGLQVVLIERGPYPGSKNLSGGVLYTHSLHQILPNFWEEAPVERCITNQVVIFMTGSAHFNIDYKDEAFSKAPYNAFTVLRGKFDRWLAEQAEAAGAILVPRIRVDRVLRGHQGEVIGIAAGEEEMLADVVIAADGANSFLAQEAGLRGRIPTHQVGVGVKELIALPRETIEERFRLDGREGAAYAIVGYATQGVAGGGFLYTNLDTISAGLVMRLDDLVQNKLKPGDVIEDFLSQPMIAGLVKGGKLVEYGAHLVPEGGLAMMPRLVADGILVVGDAAGLGVNNGFVIRGMDLAIGSAAAAAEAILEARARNDFSTGGLGDYAQKLEKSFVLADMRTYARTPEFFSNDRLYHAYPAMLTDLMRQIYTHHAVPREHLVSMFSRSARENGVSLFDLVRDLFSGVRSL